MLGERAGHLAFRHELARLAVEQAIRPGRRLVLHRTALTALAARDGDPARLAHHAEAAGDAKAVIRWAPAAAGRAASSGAHREAAAQDARALRFADHLPRGDAHRASDALRRGELRHVPVRGGPRRPARGAGAGSRRRRAPCGGRRAEAPVAADVLRQPHERGGRVGGAGGGGARAAAAGARAGDGLRQCLAAARGRRRRARAHSLGARAPSSSPAARGRRGRRLRDDERRRRPTQSEDADGPPTLERALALAQRQGLEEYAGRIFNQSLCGRCASAASNWPPRSWSQGLEYCSERGLDMWRLYLLAMRARWSSTWAAGSRRPRRRCWSWRIPARHRSPAAGRWRCSA